MLGSDHRAEDAAQEALLRAWDRRERCQTPERPDGWLSMIARREALRMLAASREAPAEFVESVDPVAPFADTVDLQTDVSRALAGLSPEDAALLTARYWMDLTQAQAAVELAIPEGTAKVRLHRVRRHLAEVLITQ